MPTLAPDLPAETRDRATRLLGLIELRRRRWEQWFPNPESQVEVPRADLLALAECAAEFLRSREAV